MGTHLRVLSESFPMNTNLTGFRWFSNTFCIFLPWAKVASALQGLMLNPFDAEVTFIKGTKTFQTLPCWYSLDSPREVLSDEYPYARVSVISQLFSHCFVVTKLTTSSTKVKEFLP